jgi:hypothetical protein
MYNIQVLQDTIRIKDREVFHLKEDLENVTRINVLMHKMIEPIYQMYSKDNPTKNKTRNKPVCYKYKDVIRWAIQQLRGEK